MSQKFAPWDHMKQVQQALTLVKDAAELFFFMQSHGANFCDIVDTFSIT